jgi:FtsP/CotA-like multicopper oxidase with cupredoxin domain
MQKLILSTLVVLVGLASIPVAGSQAPERISINDNRTAAGTLTGTTLTIRLSARRGQWHPDRDTDPGVGVKAFAVDDGPLQIPGPMIRVQEGTEIRAVVRNTLDAPLAMHGLYSRPGAETDLAAQLIPPGQMREFRFMAGAPGTYYYWAASDAAATVSQRPGPDSQLSGAFIVDPRGGAQSDRVLLVNSWREQAAVPAPLSETVFRFVINGRSWPHTERFTYRVGDTVRMRLINAGDAVHPMHLHGFYFNVDSRGTERANTIYPTSGSPHLAVTERMAPGQTFALTWKPTRPGNWLFHCHDNVHLEHGGPFGGRRSLAPATHLHGTNHALEMMAGPVMGITVTGATTEAPDPAGPRRQLQLVARIDNGGTSDEPSFGYTLHSGSLAPPPPPYLPGPTILLKRGEPVSITVINQMTEPTAVHWHGIELESYYDGVAGYAGDGTRIAPAIVPGASFEARFTPRRSGTFIYHTHVDEVRQQKAGLSGALLVLDDPASYDPERDLVFMITTPRKNADAEVVLLNGTSTPKPRELRAGQHYRLRFINVHISRPSMRMRLLNGSTPLTWRNIAKDGMDLPPDQLKESPSEIQMGNGETYDFDFVPTAGDIHLDVTNNVGALLVSMPIRVR